MSERIDDITRSMSRRMGETAKSMCEQMDVNTRKILICMAIGCAFLACELVLMAFLL